MKKYRNRSQSIQDFLRQRTLAVVGVSRNGKKFGRMVYSQLKEIGYRVFPVNPNTEAVNGDRCYPTLSKLPEPVGGVVLIVPPVQAEQLVREASALGIQHVWL